MKRAESEATLFAYCDRCKVLWLGVQGGHFIHWCEGIRSEDGRPGRLPPERVELPTQLAAEQVRL